MTTPQTSETGATLQKIINNLIDGNVLHRDDAKEAMRTIMAGEATPAQIGAFITAVRIRGETPEIIIGCALAMREKFVAIPVTREIVVDTCGTGGDGANTFNISTCAAFVAAGAGITVAKHGNRSVSSRCGSADVLQALGVNISSSPEIMANCLHEIGIAFLFAPMLHPAMKHALGPRRELGFRSIFNLLGPLLNPARARYGVLGVYNRSLVPLMTEAALALGAEHMFVVHGLDGLDEITTTTRTVVGEINKGRAEYYEIHPEDLGLPLGKREEIGGGTPAENAATIQDVLAGKGGPQRDIVLINAAAAILAANQAKDFRAALELAANSIDRGLARRKLEDLCLATK